MLRATPALLGLFSLVTLLVHTHLAAAGRVHRAAWCRTSCPTFAEAVAVVWSHPWGDVALPISPCQGDVVKVPRALFERLTEVLCYAA